MYSNVSGKSRTIFPKNSAFPELQVLKELIFGMTFQFSTFILKKSSKWCLSCSYFSAVFEKLANILQQELTFNHILKDCLISQDLQIIRKKADTVLISVYSSCTAENFKAILEYVRDLEFAKYNTLQPFAKTRQ